jgi:hypothetical protein
MNETAGFKGGGGGDADADDVMCLFSSPSKASRNRLVKYLSSFKRRLSINPVRHIAYPNV